MGSVYLPAIFPSYITGAITASGGSWKCQYRGGICDVGVTTLVADGLGISNK